MDRHDQRESLLERLAAAKSAAEAESCLRAFFASLGDVSETVDADAAASAGAWLALRTLPAPVDEMVLAWIFEDPAEFRVDLGGNFLSGFWRQGRHRFNASAAARLEDFLETVDDSFSARGAVLLALDALQHLRRLEPQ